MTIFHSVTDDLVLESCDNIDQIPSDIKCPDLVIIDWLYRGRIKKNVTRHKRRYIYIIMRQLTLVEYGENCTMGYHVEIDKPCTVEELIKEILKRNEWGNITIQIENPLNLKYDNDKLISQLPSQYCKRNIHIVTAHGGLSNIDYIIYLEN